jgi:hypothetical protein
MSVILIYAVLVILGDGIAVAISSQFERISEPASLLVFFALFVLVFWLAWRPPYPSRNATFCVGPDT